MQRNNLNIDLSNKLKTLPTSAGVYFHKSKSGEIIYIGKAAVLKNRVKQYFQNTINLDVKTRALVAEIYNTDWIETDSEIDALFLEAEMVKRYMPRYNILLRDDKSLIFIRIDMKNEWPHVSFTRNPIDDKAEYFGPYYNGFAVKKALRYLRRIFPYYTKSSSSSNKIDLDAHLGLSPVGMTSKEYKNNLKKLISYINGNRKKLVVELKKDMKKAADNQDFELAAKIRNKIYELGELQHRIMFGDKEYVNISKDQALSDLTELLNLEKIPARIDGFDISHTSGTNVVASMVVFSNGVSDRAQYRKFKTRTDKNDDFYNMNETITRRFSQKNLKSWGRPDLVLIDGGKGQLDAAIKARDQLNQHNVPFIGLAKRDEQIIYKVSPCKVLQGVTLYDKADSINRDKVLELKGSIILSDKFILINLPKNSHIIKLLQRIRDESHRFAISYHTSINRLKQTSSDLEKIPGIGPKTRSKLIKKFGSIRNLKNVADSDIVNTIGDKKSGLVINYIKAL